VAHTAITAEQRCIATKTKAAGKKADAKLKCHATAALRGTSVDPACLQRAETKFTFSFGNADAKGGCTITNDGPAIEAKVDAFVEDVMTELSSGGTVTTTLVTGTTTTTQQTCCGGCPGAEIDSVTGPGIVAIDSLSAFPIPGGIRTTLDIDFPTDCRHTAIVPAGGFDAPAFCLAGLGFTSKLIPLGCESGGAHGLGTVWDEFHACADADITRFADTSDGVCNPAGQSCTTTPGGAGNNKLGSIDTMRGDGTCDTQGNHVRLDIPVRATTWSDNDGSVDCPDEDGAYDSGQDGMIAQFDFILSPTTASTRAQFVDKNADGCSFSGGGPASTRRCSNDHSRPCSFNVDCGSGTCQSGALVGAPAPSPCGFGGSSVLVASGVAFSGAGPLFDLIFSSSTPTSITAVRPLPSTVPSCTLTTNPCVD
jgi:hypothetical protein